MDGLTRLPNEQMCVRERGDGTIDVARYVNADGYHHWEPLVLANLPDDLSSIKPD
jgi:hypothetical protein